MLSRAALNKDYAQEGIKRKQADDAKAHELAQLRAGLQAGSHPTSAAGSGCCGEVLAIICSLNNESFLDMVKLYVTQDMP